MSATILIIDDDLDHVETLKLLLAKRGHAVMIAPDARKAIAILKRLVPDAILMETALRDHSGFRLCKAIKLMASTARVPVIFVSKLTDPADRVAGFDAGATDFISKPYAYGELLARLERAIHQKRNEEDLFRKASKDQLTGILNRGYLLDRINRDLAVMKNRWSQFSVLMLDIDHFKSINDTYGHPTGDLVLCQITATIKRVLRKGDVLGRYGGEEFAISLPNASFMTAIAVANRVRVGIERAEVRLDKGLVPVTASIGLAVRIKEADALALIERADRAMYHAKQSGRNLVGYEEAGTCHLVTKPTHIGGTYDPHP